MLRVSADDGVEDAAMILDQVGFHGVEDLKKFPATAMGAHQDAGQRVVQHDQRLGFARRVDDSAVEFEIGCAAASGSSMVSTMRASAC